jgi:D-galactarolactone cycloisomerase
VIHHYRRIRGMVGGFSIRSIEAFCYRYPLTTPVVTSFGSMLNRPAVFVRAVDEDGVEGWGEAWSNFPAPGAEHRARLVNEVLAPGLVGRRFDGPAHAFETLSRGTEVLALQCGEPGPFAQAISGIDLCAVGPLFAPSAVAAVAAARRTVPQD